jgi:Ion transport protein
VTQIDIAGTIDVTCLVIYCVEAVLKLIALSALTGPHAYFRSPWNCLDFIVVGTSLLSGLLDGLGWAQALRLLRVLRPLRLISRVKEIQAVVTCLYKSLLSVINVVAIAFVLILVFAILGMELFMGEFYSCSSPVCCVDAVGGGCVTVIDQDQCTGYFPPPAYYNTSDPTEIGAKGPVACAWTDADFSFDNLWKAVTSLLVLLVGSDVEDCMLLAWDVVGQGKQPQPGASVRCLVYISSTFQFSSSVAQ